MGLYNWNCNPNIPNILKVLRRLRFIHWAPTTKSRLKSVILRQLTMSGLTRVWEYCVLARWQNKVLLQTITFIYFWHFSVLSLIWWTRSSYIFLASNPFLFTNILLFCDISSLTERSPLATRAKLSISKSHPHICRSADFHLGSW